MKAANFTITPDTTFSQLKALVPDASGIHTPDGKILINDPEQVALISVEENGGTVTVYESGFFSFQDGLGRPTARAVHNCSTAPARTRSFSEPSKHF